MTVPSTAPIGATLVTFAGDLTSTIATEAKAQLAAAAEKVEAGSGAAKELRIDLRKARMVDSVGLNLLVGTIKRVRAAGGSVTLVVAAASVERILTFTRITQIARVVRG